MSNEPAKASVLPEMESPCVKTCTIDTVSGLCTGCGRTLDEIALWSVLDDDDKRTVWALLPERLAGLGSLAEGPAEPRPAA